MQKEQLELSRLADALVHKKTPTKFLWLVLIIFRAVIPIELQVFGLPGESFPEVVWFWRRSGLGIFVLRIGHGFSTKNSLPRILSLEVVKDQVFRMKTIYSKPRFHRLVLIAIFSSPRLYQHAFTSMFSPTCFHQHVFMATRQSKTANYFLRWRIFARIRLFLRPSFRRPLPVFFVPTR